MNIPSPPLILQTICFDDSDKPDAQELGAALYDVLSRQQGKPLAHGLGIPVYSAVSPDAVELDVAQKLVLLPVLGRITHATRRREVVQQLKDWHQKLGEGHVIPVPVSANWRAEESDLPGKNLLTQLYGKDDRRQRTIDEIIISILRLFDSTGAKSSIFLSHAKADLAATQNAAEAIRNYINSDLTAKAFFDVNDLSAGIPLRDQINKALQQGVFVAVRTDAYSSRDWCLHELLQAKRNRLPTLTVELLASGEALSSPYAGNAPTVVWSADETSHPGSNPQRIVSRALVECLRAAHFLAETERITQFANLPSDAVALCRPPELLDLIQGPVKQGGTQVVLHPDPEMPTAYRELLSLAHPGLRLMTPATAFRTLGKRTSAVANPFDGIQIGFSISDSPDTNGPCGFTKEHIDDVAVHLSRSLISTGAHLAYGGDFRQGGYTIVLSELISAYRQTAGASDDILHSYIAAHLPLTDVPDNLQLELHHLDLPPLRSDVVLPSPKSAPRPPDALYFSDMRRVMTNHIYGRLLLGGAALPRVDEIGQKGYGGLYPGVIEEAWWSLRAGRPMYVMGGFGGAAGIVAELMCGNDIPELMQESKWQQYPSFAERADQIVASSSFALLGVPSSMDHMAQEIRMLTEDLLKTDDAALAWNGLNVAENQELLFTRDALRITALVHRGLGHCVKRRREGKLTVELVEGSVTAAQGLDVIAVGVFEGLPLGGAGAALDHLVSGRASVAHAAGQSLVGIDTPGVAAAFLYLASLGKFDDVGNLPARVRAAAESTAACAVRHQFSRLGIVSYGGAMLGASLPICESMISGLGALTGQTEIIWFESDTERFAGLRRILENDSRISLTTRRISTPPTALVTAKIEQLVVSVSLESDLLTVTVMPPSGTGVAGTRRIPFTRKQMIGYSRGAAGRNTPPAEELAIRGQDIAKLLLGDDVGNLLKRCRHARIALIHDVASSQLPFEALFTPSDDGEIRPAIDSGINRRLAVSGLATHQLFARPPHAGKLRVLVVINPLGDLTGAQEEGKSVCAELCKMNNVQVIELAGKAATKPAFLKAIAEADVLHYCGHAFFDGPGPEESGLNLWGDALFFSDLAAAPSDLRVVFANACEAGRVRAPDGADEAASFAEFLLRTGLEAFLGTFWRVADSAALSFAKTVYSSLTKGETFDTAVKKGRSHLLQTGSPEWANYVLYGEGQFRIVTG